MKRVVYIRYDGLPAVMRPHHTHRREEGDTDDDVIATIARNDISVKFTDAPEIVIEKLGAALKPGEDPPTVGTRAWALHFGIAFTDPPYAVVDASEIPESIAERLLFIASKTG
jgi:hypothetical protein